MGENQLLVDTDILIAYLNHKAYRAYLENPKNRIYYSAITKKELLSKQGLRASERQAILTLLHRFRLIRLDQCISSEYSRLRLTHPSCSGRCSYCSVRSCETPASSNPKLTSLSRAENPCPFAHQRQLTRLKLIPCAPPLNTAGSLGPLFLIPMSWISLI